MKILYYCPEYHSRHGGRAHARGFYHALEKLPSVSGAYLYPDKSLPLDKNQKQATRGKLRFLPETVRRIVQYFVPRHELARALISEIKANSCDAIVIRTSIRLPALKDIKRACPDTLICLEINSVYFDESFIGLALRSAFQKWEVKRLNRADALVVVSSYLKTYLEVRGVDSGKILVNQNGVDENAINLSDVSDVREQYGIPVDSFVLGYIGGMEPFRRLPEVVAAIAELRRAGNDDIYLLLVGDGTGMPAIQAAIEAEGEALGNAVKLAGWQEHSRIPEFLKAFNLAIFPFTNDYCSPLKLFEYLGAGVPAIGPDTPAVREVFEDGIHLKLVKQDGSDFISTVLELKNNPQLGIDLGEKGQQLVLKEYTWKNNAERVVSHIQNRSSGRHKCT